MKRIKIIMLNKMKDEIIKQVNRRITREQGEQIKLINIELYKLNK